MSVFESNRRQLIATWGVVLLCAGVGTTAHAETIDLFGGDSTDDETTASDETPEASSMSDSDDSDAADDASEEKSDSDEEAEEGELVIERMQGGGESAVSGSAGPSGIPGRGAGRVTLEFERQGHVILVPAQVEGHSVYFLFDTGATYTTLTPSFAREIGAMPGDDAPTTVTKTANGPRRTAFGVVSRLYLGSRPHTGVTFTVCEPCGSERGGRRVVGLLGLNVLRRYETSINEADGVVELTPNRNHDNRWADIEPWLEWAPAGRRTVETQGDVYYQFRASLRNRSSRSIRNLELEFECRLDDGTKTVEAETRRLDARSETEVTARVRRLCERVRWDVASATW